MEHVNENESVLQLKNLYFEKITFERGETVPKKFVPQFAAEHRKLEGTTVEVKLKCRILGDDEPIIELILVGVFDNKSSDPDTVEELNKMNTVSIMFPYLRSELSLLTAQPNFPVLNLPVMNINALLGAQGNN